MFSVFSQSYFSQAHEEILSSNIQFWKPSFVSQIRDQNLSQLRIQTSDTDTQLQLLCSQSLITLEGQHKVFSFSRYLPEQRGFRAAKMQKRGVVWKLHLIDASTDRSSTLTKVSPSKLDGAATVLQSWRRAEKTKRRKWKPASAPVDGEPSQLEKREVEGKVSGELGLQQLKLDTFTQETVAGEAVCGVHKHCFSSWVAVGCYGTHYCRASRNIHGCCRQNAAVNKDDKQRRHYYF